MRLLLDTHVLLWSQSDPTRLGAALDLVLDLDNELLVSAASAWEIAIKMSTGRLSLPDPPAVWVPSRIAAMGARPVAVEHADALAVADLPSLHRDPFDRLLVVQARRLAATLVTADDQVQAYGGAVVKV